jgi:hypothetical protein
LPESNQWLLLPDRQQIQIRVGVFAILNSFDPLVTTPLERRSLE